MSRSRYPRRGHRLAPATLRELLRVPIPARYFEGRRSAGMLLCDLDETAWGRFGEEACRELAQEVLRAVGLAARARMAIGGRHLPPIPEGMSLADLGLEVRTFNCLASAGIHERPQDLHSMTIENVLGLHGFWAKSLVDLLTSLEYVTDHPQARRVFRTDAVVSIKHLRVVHRYPRLNHRLAPQTLKEVLLDRLPGDLVSGTQFHGARLCDLDKTAWEHFSPQVIGRLAALIVLRAGSVVQNQAVMHRRLPKLPERIRLEDLRLENRTYNCLKQEGFGRHPEDLGRLTVADLLSIQAFGVRCLVDLLTSLETQVAREGKLNQQLTAEAEALGNMPEAAGIQFTDPRLGHLLRGMDTESNTVGEMAVRIIKRQLDPPDPPHFLEQLVELRETIRQLSESPLEEELMQIFAPGFSSRDQQIVAEYYGWDGGGGHTLEQVGRKYALSRERIRQICSRAIKRNRNTVVFAPVLDRSLALLEKRIPIRLDKLQSQLDAARDSPRRLPVEAILQAAGCLSRRPRFVIVDVGKGRLAIQPKHAKLPRVIAQAARHLATTQGAAKIRDVMSELAGQVPKKVAPVLIRETLETWRGLRPQPKWIVDSGQLSVSFYLLRCLR